MPSRNPPCGGARWNLSATKGQRLSLVDDTQPTARVGEHDGLRCRTIRGFFPSAMPRAYSVEANQKAREAESNQNWVSAREGSEIFWPRPAPVLPLSGNLVTLVDSAEFNACYLRR
jgi:hypothetical protein